MNALTRLSRAVATRAPATVRAVACPARQAHSLGLAQTARAAVAPACVHVGKMAYRNLHVPVTGYDPKRSTDKFLQTLQKEISHEQETYTGTPEDIDEYLRTSGWEMEDMDGNREVYLRRRIGNEEINVTFGVMDPEQTMEPAEDEEEVEMDENPLVIPFNVCLTKTADGKDLGTLTAEMVACAGRCDITQLTFSPSTDKAMGDSADDYEERLANYPGPNLQDLDPDVKDAMAEYFSARGVDDNLAAFIERVYYDKEQREYVQWLSGIHGFLSK